MRVIADTSIWVSHFRKLNSSLVDLLEGDQILCHPLIIMELACGTPPAPRLMTLNYLKKLQQATVATAEEVLSFIESYKLYESGCGAIDVALLASTLLTGNTLLWTHDKHLESLAKEHGVSFSPLSH
jgi:predicted nucleic acid-binding protein